MGNHLNELKQKVRRSKREVAEAKSHFRKVENTYDVGYSNVGNSNGDFSYDSDVEYVSGDDLYDTSGKDAYDYDTSGEDDGDTYGNDVYDTSGDFSGNDADEKREGWYWNNPEDPL